MSTGKQNDKLNDGLWGIQSDVDTFLEMYEEMAKLGLKTREEKEKFMLEFFSSRTDKIQDVVIGRDDLNKKMKDKRILHGYEEDGKAKFDVIDNREDKK